MGLHLPELLNLNKRPTEIDQVCIKCGRDVADHPSTGRFSSIILMGRECAWNPDDEFRGFVVKTLKSSGYNIEDFGHLERPLQ
jgi:hypothetical protein